MNQYTINFDRSVTEKVGNSFAFHRAYVVLQRKGKPRRHRTGALYVQQRRTAAVISTSFHLNHSSNSPYSWNALITRPRERYSSVSMSREAKRLKRSSSWLNSGNAVIQHLRERHFRVSPFYHGSTEAQVIWCGVLKCLLVVYFIGNISAKKISNLFTCVKVIGSQRWDVFWDSTNVSTLYRFRDIASYLSTVAIFPARHVFGNFTKIFCAGKLEFPDVVWVILFVPVLAELELWWTDRRADRQTATAYTTLVAYRRVGIIMILMIYFNNWDLIVLMN